MRPIYADCEWQRPLTVTGSPSDAPSGPLRQTQWTWVFLLHMTLIFAKGGTPGMTGHPSQRGESLSCHSHGTLTPRTDFLSWVGYLKWVSWSEMLRPGRTREHPRSNDWAQRLIFAARDGDAD